MSQISRRNFMKCAGAAALAIAASGILTGCDNTLDVEVTFVYNGPDPASARHRQGGRRRAVHGHRDRRAPGRVSGTVRGQG